MTRAGASRARQRGPAASEDWIAALAQADPALAHELAARADRFSPRVRGKIAVAARAAVAPPRPDGVALGAALGRRVAEVEASPAAFSAIAVLHRARLPGGDRVWLRAARTRSEPAPSPPVPGELRRVVETEIHDRGRSQPADQGPIDAAGEIAVLIPRGPTRDGIRVFDDPGALTLEETRKSPGGRDRSLARNLCAAWLFQATSGRVFSIDLEPTDVLVLPDDRFLFCGRSARLSPGDALHLRRALEALSDDEPDRVLSALLRLEGGSSLDAGELGHRLRLGAPFRDSDWDEHEDWLAPRALLLWRSLAASGLEPAGPLLDFFRGLARLEELARRLEPDHDTLREGLEDLRLRDAFAGWTRLGAWREASSAAATAIDTWTSLPLALERRLGGETVTSRCSRRRGGSSAWRAAATVLLASTGVAAGAARLAGRPEAAAWAEPAAFILLLLLGAWLLPRALRE